MEDLTNTIYRRLDAFPARWRFVWFMGFILAGQVVVLFSTRFLMIPWVLVLAGIAITRYNYLRKRDN